MNLAPAIAAPISTNVILFSGGKVILSPSVSGALPFNYQWQSNNVNIAGATNSFFTVSNAPVGYSASLVCQVSNLVASASSTPVNVSVIAAPTAPYPQAVLEDRPLGYWRLNEPDDNLNDGNPGSIAHDYWSGNDGIYTNTSLGQMGYSQKTDPTDTSALFGPALNSYAGTIAGVDFGTATGSNANFSVEAWVNGGVQSISGATIVGKGYGAGGDQFALDSQSSSTGFRFSMRDALRQAHNCNSKVLPDGQWHHLVGVCDEANAFLGLYIDGQLAATATTAPIQPGDGALASTDPMVIGSKRSSSTATSYNAQWNGLIDEVAVYGYALSSNQVISHYVASGKPPFFVPAPPTTATANENGPLNIQASVVATPPFTNTWVDLVYGTNLVQTVVTATNASAANLAVSSVPAGWNGGALMLTSANAFGSVSAIVSLTVYTGLPSFVQDLPLTALAVAGKPFTYSVMVQGALPFSYFWYSNNVLVAGQTAPSFTFAAASGNYSVVASNSYGTNSSTLSSLNAMPQLTNAYASAIRQAGAAGYWPLQETSAPAPVTIETNYGTLGAIANAYYASSNAVFGLGGAIGGSGSPDPSVGFTGGNDSYVFVPRINPALTVRPPFSVECWVLAYDTAFHDILGQSGSGLDSAGGSGNWAGFRLCQANPAGGPALEMILCPGTGSTFTNVITPDGTLPLGAWAHSVATYDGTTAILYINGQPLATNSLSMAIDSWTPFTIGGSMFYSGRPQSRLNGGVDEVAVYTNVLSDIQVANHYLAGVTYGSNYTQAVLSGKPTLYYQMDCPGYTAPDPATFSHGAELWVCPGQWSLPGRYYPRRPVWPVHFGGGQQPGRADQRYSLLRGCRL